MSESVASLFRRDGPLARAFPAVEYRESQVRMAEAVSETLEGGRLLVEAGAGTGKTFAYLVPALMKAALPERRIVISTSTRNLQEQIMEKDLPLLVHAFGWNVPVALIQGRENYVCRRRATQALESAPRLLGDASNDRMIRRILEVAKEPRRGIRGALSFEVSSSVWESVRAERGNCMQAASPFFHACAWQLAKRNAREAAILIVNHALLMADVRLRREGSALLPSYSALIVDEAHHLETVAAEHLGLHVSRGALFHALVQSERELAHHENVRRALSKARAAASHVFHVLEQWMAGATTKKISGMQDLSSVVCAELLDLGNEIALAAENSLESKNRVEWIARAEKFCQWAKDLEAALRADAPDTVHWCELVGEERGLVLRSAPIEPGAVLQRCLFAPLNAVVLTSATLTVPSDADQFAYARHCTGLGPCRALELPSPFEYAEQVKLLIDPLTDPQDEHGYVEDLVAHLPQHLMRCEGRAFVLFTSRKIMERVAERVRDTVETQGIQLLVQVTDANRSALLRRFCEEQPAALMGLASFWEGVDVPGSELSHVILTRLPFRVPDHPWDAARAESLRSKGVDPFWHQSVPEAVLRWKQGFGRLIRTASDRGWITILDSRVLTRRYGAAFLSAIPGCPRFIHRDGEDLPWHPEESS